MPDALQGDLAWVSLGGLLQLAESEATCGHLEITGLARIDLVNGRAVGARFGELEGWPALLQALLQRAGAFRMVAGEKVDGAARPIADTGMAILEGCRLVDELDRVGPMRLRAARPPEDPARRTLAAAMNGDRTVLEVLREARVREVRGVDTIIAMMEAGEAVEAAPPDRARAMDLRLREAEEAAEGPVDVDTLIDRARAAVRDRDLATAVRLFRRALEQRPGDRLVAQNLQRAEMLLAQST